MLLSHRCIVFTDQEVYFQCRQAHSCESYPALINLEMLTEPGPLEPFYVPALHARQFTDTEGLGAVLQNFILRNMTYDTDVLNALRGIMKQYTRELGTYFVHGLPLLAKPRFQDSFECFISGEQLGSLDPAQKLNRRFVTALTWEAPNDSSWAKGGLQAYGIDLERREGFPSWSWAGWKWPMKRIFGSFLGHHICPAAEATLYTVGGTTLYWKVIQTNLESNNLDDAGLSSTITLRAWAFPIKLVRADSPITPKGKSYECFVDSRLFAYESVRFNLYRGKWSWKTRDYTALYFGPLAGSPEVPSHSKLSSFGASIFFMAVKERADGKWERVGDGHGNWGSIRQFFGWRDRVMRIPGLFEFRTFDIC